MSDPKCITISRASKIKQCSVSAICYQMKKGRINSYEFAGKQYVIYDEAFRNLELKKVTSHSMLEKRIAELEERVAELENIIVSRNTPSSRKTPTQWSG